jgi:alpha-tubulin suppressor-like RCC1 family protein/tetratricopeptide (TPR) repeat protein
MASFCTAKGKIYVWGGCNGRDVPTGPIDNGVENVQFSHLVVTDNYCLALSTSGQVYSWSTNNSHSFNMGQGPEPKGSPITSPRPLDYLLHVKFVDVSTCYSHSLLLTAPMKDPVGTYTWFFQSREQTATQVLADLQTSEDNDVGAYDAAYKGLQSDVTETISAYQYHVQNELSPANNTNTNTAKSTVVQSYQSSSKVDSEDDHRNSSDGSDNDTTRRTNAPESRVVYITSEYTPEKVEVSSNEKSKAPPLAFDVDAYRCATDDDLLEITPTTSKNSSSPPSLHQSKDNLSESSRNWNKEFQELLSLPTSTLAEQITKQNALRKFCADFYAVAEEIGKVIVSEVNLVSKTYPPVNIGGIAGGEKYIVNNIFFKFCIDAKNLYGGDEWARKVANLELLGLNGYVNCQMSVPIIHFPLVMLLEYRGYRLIASTVVPIGNNTLVYGSGDAGKTVEKKIEAVNIAMDECAKLMNIKPHKTNSGVMISAPIDIEVHQGHDGFYYVLDTARVFPPEYPSGYFTAILLSEKPTKYVGSKVDVKRDMVMKQIAKSMQVINLSEGVLFYADKGRINKLASALAGKTIRGNALLIYGLEGRILYYQLRPEFVKNYAYPLNPDACFGFCKDNMQVHNREVQEATSYLTQVVIPKFAQMLNKNELYIITTSQLTAEMHKHGINLRYLGLLRSMVHDNPYVKSVIFTAMVINCLKNYVRRKMRLVDDCDNETVKKMVARYFNCLLGQSDVSDFYWCQLLKVQIEAKYGQYGQCLITSELAVDYDLRKVIIKETLLQLLSRATGVHFIDSVNQTFQTNPSAFERDSPFSSADIKEISSQRKILDIGTDEKILELIESKSRVDIGINLTDIGHFLPDMTATIKYHLVVLDQIKQVFGEHSKWFAIQAIRVALAYYQNVQYDQALSFIDAAIRVFVTQQEVNIESFVIIYYLKGSIKHHLRQYAEAMNCYLIALGALSKVAPPPTLTGTGHGQSVQMISSQLAQLPIVLLIVNQLQSLVADSGHTELFIDWCLQFYVVWKTFPFPGNVAATRRIFHADVPFPLSFIFRYRDNRIATEGKEKGWLNVISDLPPRPSFEITHPTVQKWFSFVYVLKNWTGTSLRVQRFSDEEFALMKAVPGDTKISVPIRLKVGEPLRIECYWAATRSTTMPLSLLNENQRPIKKWQIEPNKSYVYEVATQGISSQSIMRVSFGTYNYDIHMYENDPNVYTNYIVRVNYLLTMLPGAVKPHLKFGYMVESETKVPHAVYKYELQLQKQQANFALSKFGEVFSWGSYSSQWLGHGGDTPDSPKIIESLANYFVTEMKCSKVLGGNNNLFFSIALTKEGKVFTWGDGESGCLGLGGTDSALTPRLVYSLITTEITRVDCGYGFAVALSNAGKVYMWGELCAVIPNLKRSELFKDVTLTTVPNVSKKISLYPMLIEVPNGDRIVAIGAGVSHVVLVSERGGFYYVGQRYTDNVPELLPLSYTELIGGHQIVDAACGTAHTLLLTSEGRVFAFGLNYAGQLGNGTTDAVGGPPFATALQPVCFAQLGREDTKIVRVGAYQGCSLAIDDQWTAWVWGGENANPVCLSEFKKAKIEVHNAFYSNYNQLVVSTLSYGSYAPLRTTSK